MSKYTASPVQPLLFPDPLGDFLRGLPRLEAILAVMDYFDDDPPELLGEACDVDTRAVRHVSEIPEFFIDGDLQNVPDNHVAEELVQ